MSDSFYKYPSTPHLVWLNHVKIRSDKVMSKDEVDSFLKGEVVVEEKIDGANLGLSLDGQGRMCFQNRGEVLAGKLSGQWAALRGWFSNLETPFRKHLPHDHILFGEWCYAKHSIFYDRLPDWFVGFDVFDSQNMRFWSTERRNKLFHSIGITSIPIVARGRFSLADLERITAGASCFSSHERMEGIYLRKESSEWLQFRCKVVGPAFQQSIEEHWTKGPLGRNLRTGYSDVD